MIPIPTPITIRYNRVPTEEERAEEREESGWKLVHADVFRPPTTNPMLLAVFVGTVGGRLFIVFIGVVVVLFFNLNKHTTTPPTTHHHTHKPPTGRPAYHDGAPHHRLRRRRLPLARQPRRAHDRRPPLLCAHGCVITPN